MGFHIQKQRFLLFPTDSFRNMGLLSSFHRSMNSASLEFFNIQVRVQVDPQNQQKFRSNVRNNFQCVWKFCWNSQGSKLFFFPFLTQKWSFDRFMLPFYFELRQVRSHSVPQFVKQKKNWLTLSERHMVLKREMKLDQSIRSTPAF